MLFTEEATAATPEPGKLILDVDVKEICFGTDEKINQTEYTQIAMFTTEMAILEVIRNKGFKPDVCAGLSLGQYAAIAASNAIADEDLFELIRLRGKYMQEAYPVGGAMSAVLGMEAETVNKICEETVIFEIIPDKLFMMFSALLVYKMELPYVEIYIEFIVFIHK